MAYFENGNLKLYYEDVGQGKPIIANHGLSEDTTYWSDPGVTAALAEHYRVISIDMRGHGRTIIEGEPKGYDEVTMGDRKTKGSPCTGLQTTLPPASKRGTTCTSDSPLNPVNRQGADSLAGTETTHLYWLPLPLFVQPLGEGRPLR